MQFLPEIRTITLIGSGNVAWHLGRGFHLKGLRIHEICSRSESSARELAGKVGAGVVTDPGKLSPGSDLYIIAVSDSGIAEVARELKLENKLVVHTSGSVPLSEISAFSSLSGVFYPLQTFSKHIPVNLAEVPFCLEASAPEALDRLKELAMLISPVVLHTSSEERLLMHLAAVFASNYTNLMYTLASEILATKGLSFDLLKPLVAETARKVITGEPHRVQTGPARRGDRNVIGKHLELLASMPEYAEIYRLLAGKINPDLFK